MSTETAADKGLRKYIPKAGPVLLPPAFSIFSDGELVFPVLSVRTLPVILIYELVRDIHKTEV
jgi:hypothetical protein